MVGIINAIDNAIAAIKNNGLVLKVMEGLQDYLSCKIKFSADKKRAWLRQPQNMDEKFGKLVKNVHSHKTPGMPKFLVVRPMKESKRDFC